MAEIKRHANVRTAAKYAKRAAEWTGRSYAILAEEGKTFTGPFFEVLTKRGVAGEYAVVHPTAEHPAPVVV